MKAETRELIERTVLHTVTLPDGWCQVKTAFYAELLEDRIEMLGALKAICGEAESWHTMHGHGPDSVQCDSICALIPRMKAIIEKAEAT